MRWKKVLVLIFIGIFLYTGCSYKSTKDVSPVISDSTALSQNEAQSKDAGIIGSSKQNLTISDIKKKYQADTGKTIIDITEYKNYALIEYNKDNDMFFDWYNLNTGDIDLLPVWDTHAKLMRITDENNLVFISDGYHIPSNHSYFPHLILCERKKEIIDSDDDFFTKSIDKYFRLDEQVKFGNSTNMEITDIRVSLTGIEILFKPEIKENSAWYISAPDTRTSYVGDKKQFIIEFIGTRVNTGSIRKRLSAATENLVFNSVEVSGEKNSSKIIINMKEPVKFYTAREIHASDDDSMPIEVFTFRSSVDPKNY